jgi:hypothetical protein
MDQEELNSEQIKKAKELATGPLGQQLSKYPLRFAAAVLIGEKNKGIYEPTVNNGTVSLVDFGNGPIAITCSHVLDEYRKRLQGNESTFFHIGSLELDPLSSLIDESEDLDLATIDLSNENLNEIHEGGEIGSCMVQPPIWPPGNITEGDYVAFGGFPGLWKERPLDTELVFPSFSSGACRVAAVGSNYFVVQFEREYWVQSFAYDQREDLYDLGGLSGGPVFINRDLYFDFIGIIYQFSPAFDLMRIRPSRLIRKDGCIIKDGV